MSPSYLTKGLNSRLHSQWGSEPTGTCRPRGQEWCLPQEATRCPVLPAFWFLAVTRGFAPGEKTKWCVQTPHRHIHFCHHLLKSDKSEWKKKVDLYFAKNVSENVILIMPVPIKCKGWKRTHFWWVKSDSVPSNGYVKWSTYRMLRFIHLHEETLGCNTLIYKKY